MVIQRLRPPAKEKLKAHYFDRYANTIEDGKVLSSVGDQSRPVEVGRCYNFDGVDDYILITTANIGGLFISGVDENGDLVTDLTIIYDTTGYKINKGAGKVWNIKVWVDNLATDEQKKSFMLDGAYGWYKCDEGGGTKSYDSSVNGNHGTITNATLTSFHSTQDIYSYQNEVGYSTGKAFAMRPSDVQTYQDTYDFRYLSAENIIYYFQIDSEETDGLDPDGNPIGYTSEYFNFYKNSILFGGSAGVVLKGSYKANTIKIDLLVKQGRISDFMITDVSLKRDFQFRITEEFGAGYNSFFTIVEDFYYSISGTDPTYGESYPETKGFPLGTTSTYLREILSDIGLENVNYFIEGLATANFASSNWSLSLEKSFVLTVDFNNTEREVHTFLITDIFATGSSGGVSGDYFLNYNKEFQSYDNIQFRSVGGTWAHIYRISIQENHHIPASSDPTKDALGDELEFKGQVAYNGLLKNSNCINFDGVDDYIQFSDVIDWATIESQGTAVLTLDLPNMKITGTAGTVYDLKVKDGSGNVVAHYPMAEGAGTAIYDVSGNNHGTLFNTSSLTVWGKQDFFHYNLATGYHLYRHDIDPVVNPDIRVPKNLNPAISGYSKVSSHLAGRQHNGAETELDFTGGVASPYAVGKETDYKYGDETIDYKMVESEKESKFLIYEEETEEEITMINNYLKK